MRLEISAPCCIAPNLEPGIRVGDSWVTISYSCRPGREGRTRYRVSVIGGGIDHTDHDLQSGCGGGSLAEGLRSALSFLSAAAEAARYPGSDNANLYPPDVTAWASEHSGELETASLEMEEAESCIVESAPRA